MARETASQPVDTKSPVITPTIWRIAFWGCGALIALAAVTLAAVSESGAQRLGLALNAVTGLPERQQTVVAQIPAKPTEPSADTIKLAENTRLLTADRDRLNARVASLEHALEDVIGSIKRQAAATEQAAPALSADEVDQTRLLEEFAALHEDLAEGRISLDDFEVRQEELRAKLVV